MKDEKIKDNHAKEKLIMLFEALKLEIAIV